MPDSAIRAIAAAEEPVKSCGGLPRAALQKMMEAIQMERQTEWTDQYYGEEALASPQRADRGPRYNEAIAGAKAAIQLRCAGDYLGGWRPEDRAGRPNCSSGVSGQWAELIAEVEAALTEDPAGEKARGLAARWMALIHEFTGGDREIEAGAGRMWVDRRNWPANMNAKAPVTRPEVWRFIQSAIEEGKKRG